MDRRWLLEQPQLYSRAQVLAYPCPVPARPGLYGWFFRELPHPDIDPSRCVTSNGLVLLYLGISPAREKSTQNLSTRIKAHFDGNAYGSTLRLTLGALLAETLGLTVTPRGNKGRITFGASEVLLSEWMAENAFVAWTLHDKPWEVEEEIIASLDLPLNIKGNRNHPFCPTLTQVRRRVRRSASDRHPRVVPSLGERKKVANSMKGRTVFTESEITQLKQLIRRKVAASRSAQKGIRHEMRNMGFYISDFRRGASGFDVADLDDLIRQGAIRATGD